MEAINSENISLEECIKEILKERKQSGSEWTTALTVYDVLMEKNPSVADECQLVDVRDVLSTSDWIEKDDFYYRIKESAFSNAATSSELQYGEEQTSKTAHEVFEEVYQRYTDASPKEKDLYISQVVDAINNLSSTVWVDVVGESLPKAKIDAVKDISIESLDLGVRAFRGLWRANIRTVGELAKTTSEELLIIRTIGGQTQREIKEKLISFLGNYDENGVFREDNTHTLEEVEEREVISTDMECITGSDPLIKNFSEIRIDEVKDILKDIPINALELSVRSFNCLASAGIMTMGDLAEKTPDDLCSIRNFGQVCLREVLDEFQSFWHHYDLDGFDGSSVSTLNEDSTPQKIAIQGTIIYDIPIEQMELSARAYNCLSKAGIKTISEILYWEKDDYLKLKNMGLMSADEILDKIQELFESGEIIVAATDEEIQMAQEKYYSSEHFQKKISTALTALFIKAGCSELTVENILNRIAEPVDKDFIIPLLENLVQEGVISEKNGYYKKVYPSILEAINLLPEDHQDYFQARLEGKTLEEIGKDAGITRERVRQIIAKDLSILRYGGKKFRPTYHVREDKYQYLYENYSISKSEWIDTIGEAEYIYNYLQIAYKRGSKSLMLALDDELIDDEIKNAIQESEDENYIIVGNKKIAKQRKEIEDYVLYHYFKDGGTVEEFFDTYNSFLEECGMEDGSLFAHDEYKRTRVNRLAESRKVLWKQNKRLRYYDIDGTDYQELFDVLDLKKYENIELSTLKFMRDYPELMAEYDIRDEYELHNLLKKICDPAEFHDIAFGRMPGITFGHFNRDEAVKEMLYNLAPISQNDLAKAISGKYGIKENSIKANWLNCIDEYYINGEYHTGEEDDQLLSDTQLVEFKELLCEDFYLTEELERLYSKVIGERGTPKPYLLKKMGFKVFADYIFRGEDSATEFFTKMLTKEDVVDLSSYGTKLRYLRAFSVVEYALREEYVILEFEPYKYVNMRRLNSFGLDKSDIITYCDEIKEFVGNDNYFTVPWIRNQGFTSTLDDLGFGDFFYEAILAMDPGIYSFIQRSNKRKGASLLRVGEKIGSKTDFLARLIEKEGAIDRDELMNFCISNYNLYVDDHNLFTRLEDTDIYYDKIMDKFYANYSLYFEEI